jgi:ribonuclease BN (tRNA processing enzyme)
MDTRIIILSDNRTDNPLLETEHGLSVYLEYNGRKYLLDTGASDLFMRNAEKLGVDLGEVDYCLISHGHNDHIGGLPAFLEMNHRAKVILSSEIPGAEYASVRRYLHSITGVVDFQKHRDRFVFIKEDSYVDGIHVYSHLAHHHAQPLGDRTLLIKSTTVKLLLAFIIFIFKTLLLKFYVRITPTRRRREKARDGPYYFQGHLVVFETGAAAPKNNEKNVETSPWVCP